jgi:hypothetical protein
MDTASDAHIQGVIEKAYKEKLGDTSRKLQYVLNAKGIATKSYYLPGVEDFFQIQNIHIITGLEQEQYFKQALSVHYHPPKYELVWHNASQYAPIDFDIKCNTVGERDIRVEVKTRYFPVNIETNSGQPKIQTLISVLTIEEAKRYGNLYIPLTKMKAFKEAFPKKRCIYVCRLKDGYYYAEYDNSWWNYRTEIKKDERTNNPDDKVSYLIPIRLYKKYIPEKGFPLYQVFDRTQSIAKNTIERMTHHYMNDLTVRGQPVSEYIKDYEDQMSITKPGK